MRGNLYILTAPSGAGKTTLARGLIAKMEGIQLSVSYTTRSPRQGEKSGIDYRFVDESEFQTMIAEGAFLEYAQVHGHYYGTSYARTEECLRAGTDVILAIDWQGAQQIRLQFKKAISIFVLPPSKQILQQRLEWRGEDHATVIAQRLAAAAGEVAHCVEFDYIVVNDLLEQTLQDVQSIVRANRLLCQIQILRHAKLLAEWLPDR